MVIMVIIILLIVWVLQNVLCLCCASGLITLNPIMAFVERLRHATNVSPFARCDSDTRCNCTIMAPVTWHSIHVYISWSYFIFNLYCILIICYYVVIKFNGEIIWRRLCAYRFLHCYKFHSDILLCLNFHSAFYQTATNIWVSAFCFQTVWARFMFSVLVSITVALQCPVMFSGAT